MPADVDLIGRMTVLGEKGGVIWRLNQLLMGFGDPFCHRWLGSIAVRRMSASRHI